MHNDLSEKVIIIFAIISPFRLTRAIARARVGTRANPTTPAICRTRKRDRAFSFGNFR